MSRRHKKSGKLVVITEGEYKEKKGKIYNRESPREGTLLVHLDSGEKISIASYKVQIRGFFD